jgi:hypothetical protein
MARTVLTDVTVTIGGTSFSNHIKSVVVTTNVDDVELTAMGDTSHTHSPGLRDDSMEFEFYQDFSASVHAAIQPLLGRRRARRSSCIRRRAIGSTSNPSDDDGRDPVHVLAARRRRWGRLR